MLNKGVNLSLVWQFEYESVIFNLKNPNLGEFLKEGENKKNLSLY